MQPSESLPSVVDLSHDKVLQNPVRYYLGQSRLHQVGRKDARKDSAKMPQGNILQASRIRIQSDRAWRLYKTLQRRSVGAFHI